MIKEAIKIQEYNNELDGILAKQKKDIDYIGALKEQYTLNNSQKQQKKQELLEK